VACIDGLLELLGLIPLYQRGYTVTPAAFAGRTVVVAPAGLVVASAMKKIRVALQGALETRESNGEAVRGLRRL
jgi:hypothetical protein